MKKLICLFLLAALVVSCKKENEDENSNMIRITSGSLSGFAYTYLPNQGYWSPVSETVKYVHLVFGNTDNGTTFGKDVMSVLFYDEGVSSVAFPSPQGQHIHVGITVEGTERYFTADDAVLTIGELTETSFKGFLTGSFVSDGPQFEYVTMEMDINIPLAEY